MQIENKKSEFLERAKQLGVNIIRLAETLDYKRPSGKIIANQIIRSATSIGANVMEAKGASSKKDYANFFAHALKSANETKYWLTILEASNLAKSILTLKNK